MLMSKQFIVTFNNDYLLGTNQDNIFNGSTGEDVFYGEKGYDTVDYSNLDKSVTIQARGVIKKGESENDQIIDIEEVIGSAKYTNTIDASGDNGQTYIDVNLSHNRLTVKNIPHLGDLNFTVKNFANVIGTNQADKIVGDSQNNLLIGAAGNDNIQGDAGDDILIGGQDYDLLDGGEGYDIVDYSHLSQPVVMQAKGLMQKGDLGQDLLIDIEEIIGASGKDNTIDASASNGHTYIDVNLGHNRLTVKNVPHIGDLNFTVKNFTNVIGTNQADKIVGNSQNNLLSAGKGNDILNGEAGNDKLRGGDGNDIIDGGAGNDTLNGGQQFDRLDGGDGDDVLIGNAGIDVLSGGAGHDLFYLENVEGRDWIKDFQLGEDRIGLADGMTYDKISITGWQNSFISYQGHQVAVVLNVHPHDLTADNFQEY